MQRSLDARARALVGLVTLALAALTWAAPPAGAAEPAAIRDYDAYPLGLGLVPPGCDAQGPDVLVGTRFSVNGGPEVASLRATAMRIGDSVTMRWEGFAPGCEGIGIGLSIKAATDVRFDPNTNQYASHQAYCGPAGTPCAAPHSLTLSLTPAAPTPCFQVDAHIGPMLSVVGPDGAYYSFGSAVDMLIDAYNGGTGPCVPEPCPAVPTLPMASVECQIATQGAPPAPDVPAPPVGPAGPAAPLSEPPAAPTVDPSVATPSDASAGESTVGARRTTSVLAGQATLPATGSRLPSGDVGLGGVALLLLGGAALAATMGRRSATADDAVAPPGTSS